MSENQLKPSKTRVSPIFGDQIISREATPRSEELDKIPKEDVIIKTDWSKDPNATSLTFTDLSYSVQVKNPAKEGPKFLEKQILRNISGICKAGELTAIMGSSGAGKTTLLNILSCRVSADGKKSKLTGNFLANGQKYNAGKFSKFAGYVMQNDILLETLTPKEVLEFTAELRIKGTAQQKKAKVEEMISDLRLQKCADTFIGGQLFKGISGGERKRTSIGVELMTDPNLLFLDEPTSGLDSFTAFVLLTLLKTLANKGKTIIFTIHQPSSDIFFLFDRLLILTKGKFIYQGSASNAVKYFGHIGYKCPEYSNPADYFIEISHAGKADSDEKFKPMFESYDNTLALEVKNEIQSHSEKEIKFTENDNSFWFATKTIAKRSAIHFFRNPIYIKTRVGQTLFFAFMICSLFFQLSSDPQDPLSQQNLNGAFFFTIVTQFLSSAFIVVLTFPTERAVFLKDYSSNMYSVSSYYFGRQAIELPLSVIFPFIMGLILYYIVGFNDFSVSKLFIFCLVLIGHALAGSAMGLAAGSVFSDVKVALGIVPLTMLPMMLFGGFYINSKNMPSWIGWVQWISPFRYSMEALMWNNYTDSSFGTGIMSDYSFDIGMWESIAILFGIGIIIRLLGLFALKKLVRKLE